MGSSKNVIGRPSKYHQLVNGLSLYLAEARANSSFPLSILAISKVIGVQKSTIYLYQHEPKVAELLNSIRVLAKARKIAGHDVDELNNVEVGGARASSAEVKSDIVDRTNQAVCLEVLAVRSTSVVQKAVWSMSRFIGRHRKHRYISDLPRIVYDLDVTLAELHRIRKELNDLSDEWRQSSQNDCEMISAGSQLSLSGMQEK